MADPYSAIGKQLLCEGQHFADVATPEAAEKTAAILNAYVEASPLSFGEAERVGERLHALGGVAEGGDSFTYADLVQAVHRFSRDEIAGRNAL